MKTSNNGINLIKKYEGCRLTAYKAVSTEKYYTIGYGHYGSDVKKGMTITQQEANELLLKDVAKFEKYVNAKNLNLNQNQFDALVSFTFNCGNGNLTKLINKRNITQIGYALTLYVKAGGKTLNGLVKRRKEEQALYFTPINTKSNEDIAKEVIAGKWGNGVIRKTKLAAAGYVYNTIQKLVNKLLKG